MRIPVNKIYRAFPELDRFSDQQCEAFVRRVKESGEFGNVSMWVGAGAIPSFLVGAILQCALGNRILRWAATSKPNSDRMIIALGVCGFILFTITAVGGMLGRDLFLRRQLRHAIWRRIERIRCEQCKYSLLGQRALDDIVQCPECGARTTLARLGLASPVDLMPPDGADANTIVD